MKNLPPVDIAHLTVRRSHTSPGVDNSDQDWILMDEEGRTIAELPYWIDDEQKATQLFHLLLRHEKSGQELGESIGRMDERQRIAYGFKVVCEPLLDGMHTILERLDDRRSGADKL